jgi:hyperosmotically inducible protein
MITRLSPLLRLAALVAGTVAATVGCGQDSSPSQAGVGEVDRTTAATAAAQQGAEPPLRVGAVTADIDITAQVRKALFAETDLKTQQIFVDTENGVVTLSGAVDSAAQRDRAKKVAHGVAGVKGVIDAIAVRTGNPTG